MSLPLQNTYPANWLAKKKNFFSSFSLVQWETVVADLRQHQQQIMHWKLAVDVINLDPLSGSHCYKGDLELGNHMTVRIAACVEAGEHNF